MYPQSEKLLKVRELRQELWEFLVWLRTKVVFAQWDSDSDTLIPAYKYQGKIDILLAEYFEIDLAALEEERTQILAFWKNGREIRDS